MAHGRLPKYDIDELARRRRDREMRLRHAVITRWIETTLPDFGAYSRRDDPADKNRPPDCSVEVLVPDQGNEDPIRTVLEAGPDIYNHATETVPRLKKRRPGALRAADLPQRVSRPTSPPRLA